MPRKPGVLKRRFTMSISRGGTTRYPVASINLPRPLSTLLWDRGFTHMECVIHDTGVIVMKPIRKTDDPEAIDPPDAWTYLE